MEISNLQLMKLSVRQISKIAFAVFCCIIFVDAKVIAQQKKYYVAASGNDNNNGLSIQTAWHSPGRINTIDFKPGDSILFEGGTVFTGTIKLTPDDNGSAVKPVVFYKLWQRQSND